MAKPKISDDGRTVTVRVPISVRKRGGRKLMITPHGSELTSKPVVRHVDNAMVKTIARAFRWREMLEAGEYATIREIALAEKISETFVGRVLRMTLLKPEIVETILAGRHSAGLTLNALAQPFPVSWQDQETQLEAYAATGSRRDALNSSPSSG